MKKRIENYWYYYKVHTLIGLAVFASLFYLLVFGTVPVNYDYQIILFMKDNAPAEYRNALIDTLTEYGEDINGDGEIKIGIINISYNESTQSIEHVRSQLELQKIMLANREYFIIITDEVGYERLDSRGVFKKDELFDSNENRAVEIKNLKFHEKFSEKLLRYKNEYFEAEKFIKEFMIKYVSLLEPDPKNQRQMRDFEKDFELVQKIIKDKK